MEKYLRLLNPKTTNFDAIGGGSHGAMTAQDVCAALSYAKLTPVQDCLLRMTALNQNDMDDLKQAVRPLLEHAAQLKAESMRFRTVTEQDLVDRSTADHVSAMYIALVEFCKVPADYKPSERNRAVIGGVSRMQIQRKLNPLIDSYKRMLQSELAAAENQIADQFNKIN